MRKKHCGVLALALCLSLLLVGCSSGSNEEDWGVALLETQSLPYDSYYQVQAVIQTVPNDRFSDTVKQILTDRWAEYLALDSTNRYTFSGLPGSYSYAFDTWAEAGAWLGITPVNPLEEVDWLEPRIRYTTPSKACPYEARFYGNEDGSVQFAGLDAAYWAEEMRLSLSVIMYTAKSEEAVDNIVEYGSYWAEENPIEFSSETYTLSDGQEALLVISGPNMNGYLGVSAYFVRDGLLYGLHAVGDSPSATAEQLRQVITRMLDEF